MPSTQTARFSRISVIPFDVKEVVPGERTAWMRASTPVIDRMREIVAGEAMMEAAERYMANPIVTWQHNTDEPIGHAVDVNATDTETLLKVYFSEASQRAREVFGMVQDRTLRAMSIGFNPYSRSFGAAPDSVPDYEVTDEILTWKRIDWLETAVVSVPANQQAIRAFAKGLGITFERPGDDATEAEEARFAEDLNRILGGTESARNIARHWRKEGRALSADLIEELRTVSAHLAELLEPYPAAQAEADEDGAPSVLTLPRRTPKLALPG